MPLHAGFKAGFDDFFSDLRPHGAANLAATINDDHVDVLAITQDGAQTRRHFSRRFDPGETTAGYDHGVASVAGWLAGWLARDLR